MNDKCVLHIGFKDSGESANIISISFKAPSNLGGSILPACKDIWKAKPLRLLTFKICILVDIYSLI